jgi:GntR family transcriptional repressor for pyruvate dehydrogenase complex
VSADPGAWAAQGRPESSPGVAVRARPDDRGLSAFRPTRTRKAAEEVVAVIVDAIRGGLYEPGDRLPRERDLAAKLEVSRAVVHEAVSVLRNAGIVSARRGNAGGIVVETRWIPPGVMADIEGESHASLRALLEVRRILEHAAALLAGQRATGEDFRELRRLVEMLDDLFDEPEEFIAVDARFHAKLGEVSGNPVLAEQARTVIHRFMAIRAQYPVGHIVLERATRNQRDTLEAIESRDGARITRAIDEHLGSVEEYFLGERLRFVDGAP